MIKEKIKKLKILLSRLSPFLFSFVVELEEEPRYDLVTIPFHISLVKKKLYYNPGLIETLDLKELLKHLLIAVIHAILRLDCYKTQYVVYALLVVLVAYIKAVFHTSELLSVPLITTNTIRGVTEILKILFYLSGKKELESEFMEFLEEEFTENYISSKTFEEITLDLIKFYNKEKLGKVSVIISEIKKRMKNSEKKRCLEIIKKSFEEEVSGHNADRIKKEIKVRLASFKVIGKGTLKLIEEIEELVKPTLNWREIISQVALVISEGMTKRIYDLTNPTFISLTYTLKDCPMIKVVKKRKAPRVDVIFALDTSGSISYEEYIRFVSEALSLLQHYKVKSVRVIFWEGKVVLDKVVNNKNLKEVKKILKRRVGFGGTDIYELLNYLQRTTENLREKILIIFTDGIHEEVDPQKTILKDFKMVVYIFTSDCSIEKNIPNLKIYKIKV